MINSKVSKPGATQPVTEEKLFKLLESIDWKLWEIMTMMQTHLDISKKNKPKIKKTV